MRAHVSPREAQPVWKEVLLIATRVKGVFSLTGQAGQTNHRETESKIL